MIAYIIVHRVMFYEINRQQIQPVLVRYVHLLIVDYYILCEVNVLILLYNR